MPNKHIELVKKWLADKDSVSSEELRANVAAAAASYAYAARADAYADYAASDAAAYSASYASYAAAASAARSDAYAVDASAADNWVKRYEELTNAK